jgi:hypothetical protein
MSIINQSRGGKDYDPDWRTRMRGSGAFADLIAQRFKLAGRRLGYSEARTEFDWSGFRVPAAAGDQLRLL